MPTRNDQLLSTPVRKLELLDIRPSELAQQLSLMEHDLCKGIQLADFENRRNNPGPYTDTIVPSIRFSNNLASWVAEYTLEPAESPRRAAVIEHFIAIAHSSREMKNLASMTAIISALNSPPIRRLTESWKLVAQDKSSQLTSCSLTCAPNNHFAMVWMTLACLDPPGVPFLGNFLLRRNIPDEYSNALLTRGYERWQSVPFSFEVDQDIQDFIKECLGQYGNGDYEHFSKLSLEREPGKREEEGAVREFLMSPFRWFQRLQ